MHSQNSPTANASAATVIGPDAHIKGEMAFDGPIRVLGTFEGKVTCGGTIELGESARCKATVEAVRVVVEGQVEGEISARETIELKAKAVVRGDINAESLVVQDGARLIGHCRVGPEAAAGAGPQTMHTSAPRVESRPVRPASPEHTAASAPAAEHREARVPGASDWMRLAKSVRAGQQGQQRGNDQSAA